MMNKLLQFGLLVPFAFAFEANSIHLIPKPPGRYTVGLSTMKLVDLERIDPYLSNNQSRALMISAFYPAAEADDNSTSCPVPYMPSASAIFMDQVLSPYGIPAGAFESFQLQVACPSQTRDCLSSRQDFPLVLFSPGFGGPRLIYSAIAQDLSSFGYIVITIDHPGDAAIVEFPDGTIITSAIPNPNATVDELTTSVAVRAQDASFVLDSVSQASIAKQLIPGARSGLDVEKVVMFGHSLGGATAVSASHEDPRIVGAVDMDGRLFGDVINSGLPKDRYFLLMETTTHNMTNDPTLAEFWQHLDGWKQELAVEGATHEAFTDMPLLASFLGDQDVFEPVLGTIKGTRIMEVMYMYLTEFFEVVLKGNKERLLKGPNKEFPEVLFPEY
jgi:dienelactone hydrolase